MNHWSQSSVKKSNIAGIGSLDIFLPIVDEDVELFEKTVLAALRIDYKNKLVYILDDGKRPEIRALCERYNVRYLNRSSTLNYKAGNLNFGLEHSQGDYILVLDADQIVEPLIASDLLGHFTNDESIAVITTRQKFDVSKYDFNNDFLFYDHMQTGKNCDNAAISVGSGVFYRRSALNKIGGFQTWNILEDLYTTFILHRNNYRSIYVNKSYTTGLAPKKLRNIYKQRSTWAHDSLRLLFRKLIFTKSGLSFSQYWHYFEVGFGYFVSAISFSILFLIFPITTIIGIEPILNLDQYLLLRITSLCGTLFLFYLLSRLTSSSIQYWISFFPIYLKAVFLALFSNKKNYKVTKKSEQDEPNDYIFLLPQLSILGLNIFAICMNFYYYGFDLSLYSLGPFFWIMFLILCFFPLFAKESPKLYKKMRSVYFKWMNLLEGIFPLESTLDKREKF